MDFFPWSSFLVCCFVLIANLSLYAELRGFVLNLNPQQGHHNISHFMNISQGWQRFWPLAYRPDWMGFGALWRRHMPLQVINRLFNWHIIFKRMVWWRCCIFSARFPCWMLSYNLLLKALWILFLAALLSVSILY